MICNELYNGQGLGNQLWNYVLARIIADKRKCEFSIIGREKFKGKEFLDVDFGAPSRGGRCPEGGPPYTLPRGIKNYYRERRENLRNTGIDISRTDEALLALPPYTKFDGNCQSTKYLEGYRENILNWIKIKEEYKRNIPDENACIIHLRCGDFATIKDVFLPPEYYRQAMAHMRSANPAVKFYCVTDQKDVARTLLPGVEIIGASLASEEDRNKAPHHYGGPVGIDFMLLMNAKYLIIPNSSLSWWAAYLNTRRMMVIAPKYWARHNISNGYWSTSDIITDGFTYLDRKGNVFGAAQCWQEKKVWEESNEEMFATVNDSKQKMPRVYEIPLLFVKNTMPRGVKRDIRDALTMSRKILGKTKRYLAHCARLPKEKINSVREHIAEYRTKKTWLSPAEIADYRKTVKIYDVFIFFNELDLLEIRFNILDPFVDYFVIVEATETFSGKEKPLYYEQNKSRFKRWEHKIIHSVTRDTPVITEGAAHWQREFYQKEAMHRALTGLSDNDICFVSDADEIWNPEILIDYSQDDIFKLRQKVYAYYLNNRSNEPWKGTFVTKYKNIRNASINHLDNTRKTRHTILSNGGWHFTNMGGAEGIRKKLESYGHQEFNTAEIKTAIENRILKNKDFVGRHFAFWKDERDLPQYLLDNKEKYKKLFK